MSALHSIKLGTAADLTKGYRPGWNPAKGILNVLSLPSEDPVATQQIQPIADRGDWSYPEITLHETAETLITEVLSYRVVNPSIDTSPPDLPAGPLVLASGTGEAGRKKLSKTLRVTLDDPDLRYALVKLTRKDGSAVHKTRETGVLMTVNALNPDPEIGIEKPFRSTLARLRHFREPDPNETDTRLTEDDANEYLDAFRNWGTHFVSSVDVGDQILQVFAYKAERFARIQSAYRGNPNNKLSGPEATDFAYFTTDATTGEFGFVSEYGTLLCLSNASNFSEGVERGDWLEKNWSKKDSVFAPFQANSKVLLDLLNETHTDQAPIGIELATLTTFTEYKRTAIWRRVLKGALATVFGDTINVNFARQDTRDFVALLPDDQPGVLSTIATPTINVYKARLDLADMQLVARDEVEEFTTFGYVVSATTSRPIELPGSQVRLFGYVLDMRTIGNPNVLRLTDKGYDSLEIACNSFLGAARIENAAGSKSTVIVDGLRHELGESGELSVTGDVRQTAAADSVDAIMTSIEYSLAFADAVLGLQAGGPEEDASPLRRLVRGYLAWITWTIPQGAGDKDLLRMRIRALDLGRYAANARYGSFVPILPASEYETYVTRIIDYLGYIERQISQNTYDINVQRQAELTIDVAKTLNTNIIQSGDLITGMIKANAAQQEDLFDLYDSVIKSRQAEAAAQQANIDNLQGLVFEQQGEVDEAVQQYKAAVKQWEAMEAVKLGLDVATNVFSLATAILVPESSIFAVKDLGLMAQRIQKTLNVLNATMKLYSSTGTAIEDLVHAEETLDGLDDEDFGDTSKLSWDELKRKFDDVMSRGQGGTEVEAAKRHLVESFSILVGRGKALAGAKSQLHQIQRDIYATQTQKALNKRQAKRLKDLTDKLKPKTVKDLDKSGIDLVGLTGHLDYLRKQMLAILSKAFLLQDQALQYANLQPPTPISSYSLLTFHRARFQQQLATRNARSMLRQYQASITTPIVYEIDGIKTEDVAGGSSYRISISPESPQFYQFVNLRVVGVVAKVEGVRSTKSGRLLVRLDFQDAPFSDRSIVRQTLTFHTPRRERTYEYDVATGTPQFTDAGESWSAGVSRVTPFGEWQISLPKTKTNREIVFEGSTIKVVLSFVLEARIIDAPAFLGHRRAFRKMAPAVELLRSSAMAMAAAVPSAQMAMSELPSPRSLITRMNDQGTVTNGWDVVFNMAREPIHAALRHQYDALVRDTDYKNTIKVQTRTKKFDLVYGYPSIRFTENNHETVRLEMPIEQGNCIQKDGEEAECDAAVSMAGMTLTANVNLSQIHGTTTIDGVQHKTLRIVLDMEQGAFEVGQIEIGDEEKVELNRAIKDYFANKKVVYLINQLDLTSVPVLDAMRPTGFHFKVLKTQGGSDILQMFIQTGGRELPNYSQTFLNNVPEPLPQGEECSLIVRSGLFFDAILPASLAKQNWKLVGRDPDERHKAPWGEFTSAVVSANNIDLSALTQEGGVSGSTGGGTWWEATYSFPENTVKWDLAGMTLEGGGDGEMILGGTKNQKMTVNTETTIMKATFFGPQITTRTGSISIDATSSVWAAVPLSVSGEEQDQAIAVSMRDQKVNVTGHLAGGGPSGSDDLQARVNQQVKRQVPNQITKQLNVSFDAISLFAIKNLLFPSNNYIQFHQAAVPGDALVLGTFKTST